MATLSALGCAGRGEAGSGWFAFCSTLAAGADGRAGGLVEVVEAPAGVFTDTAGGDSGAAGGGAGSAGGLAVITPAGASLDSGTLGISFSPSFSSFSSSSGGASVTGPEASVADFLGTGTGSVKRGGGGWVFYSPAAR